MDKAYEGDAFGGSSEEPSQETDDKKLYKGRNIVERNLRRIKQFRRVFTRYDKLDETYNAFIALANITILLKN